MNTVLRTNDQLMRILEHVRYEVEMLNQTANLLCSGSLSTDTLRDAVLESFLIHVRNLLEFLLSERGKRNLATVEDFVARETWMNHHHNKEQFRKLEKRVNNKLAHITWRRINLEEASKGWEIERIATAINDQMAAFYGLLPQGLRSDAAVPHPIAALPSEPMQLLSGVSLRVGRVSGAMYSKPGEVFGDDS